MAGALAAASPTLTFALPDQEGIDHPRGLSERADNSAYIFRRPYVLREPGTGRLLLPEETPLARAMAGERVENFEYIVHRPDADEDAWVSASAAPLRAADGSVRGAVSVFSDVTSERQLRQALSTSEERFAAFMDTSPTVAFMKDEQGRYVYANSSYTQWFHRSLDGVLGRTDAELWPPEIAADLVGYDQAARAMSETVERLMRLPYPGG